MKLYGVTILLYIITVCPSYSNQYHLSACAFDEFLLIRSELSKAVLVETLSKSKLECTYCRSVLPIFKKLAKEKKHILINCLALLLCETVLSKHWTSHVCMQTYEAYKEDLFEIILTTNLNSRQICHNLFGCGGQTDIEWDVNIPPFLQLLHNQSYKTVFKQPSVKRILHLTDIHLQTNYQPGSNAECKEPLCCFGPEISDESRRAGYFGDYRKCDLPLWTVEEIFKHIAANEKIDYVYYTGDSASHQIWNQTLADNIESSKSIFKLLNKYFGKKQILCSIGNHDIEPCNLYPATTTKNSSHLYTEIVNDWFDLANLRLKESRDTILRGGYYTTMIAPKLRLVSLNTNYGRFENWWLQVDQIDPEGQLQWLIDILKYSEANGDKVHIIGHHCPSSSLLSWSANFAEIVKRFNKTITGQMYGHEHSDTFVIFGYESNPFSVAYVAPSLTTFVNKNPSYRIYSIDKNTGVCNFYIGI
ncbi:hypothetical protein GJ496_008954 [Pomphorhynchus laevis]|nr:hypothetical protein GJ496_008954 [Pomphorhynchus laevis]